MSEIGEIITGNTPPTNNRDYYSDNGILWITPTDINSDITYSIARTLSDKGVKVGRIVPNGSILVTCIASIGKNTLTSNDSCFNQQINAVVPFLDRYHSYFLYCLSYSWSKEMLKIAGNGGMLIVKKSDFIQIVTIVPSLPEQSKIGNLFKTLDDTITLHKNNLTQLEYLKNSMLSKLFI